TVTTATTDTIPSVTSPQPAPHPCLWLMVDARQPIPDFHCTGKHTCRAQSSRRGRLAPVLSHHLACGSAPGGSEELTKCQVTFKHADQPLRLKISGVKGVVQVAGHLPWPPA